MYRLVHLNKCALPGHPLPEKAAPQFGCLVGELFLGRANVLDGRPRPPRGAPGLCVVGRGPMIRRPPAISWRPVFSCQLQSSPTFPE